MAKIKRPMRVPELRLDPPITAQVRLSEDMQQTLALLTAYADSRRVLVKATEAGVLNTVGPMIKDIVVFTAADPVFAWVGGDIPCTEIIVIAGLDNTGKVWTRPYSVGSAANAWPLHKGESFGYTVPNLNQVHVTIETTGEIAIIAYTR